MDVVRSESAAGTKVQFVLSSGVHALTEPMRFDGSVVASEVVIVGDEGAVINLPMVNEQRQLSTTKYLQRAALILSTQKIQLQGIVFQGGASSEGVSAVVVEGGEFEMHNCTVRDVQGARALHASGGVSTIRSSRFENNTGGALKASSGSKVLIRDSLLVNNRAVTNGGALAVAGSLTEVTVVATRIERNSAEKQGGGLHVAAGSVVLAHRTVLEQNTAPEGAAVHLSGGRTVYALPAPSGRWVNTALEAEIPSVSPGLHTLAAPQR